ncbi:MAG: carbamoyltransferase HypF, partial [Candidatus Bathyarchaeia archaeon]
MCDFCKHEYENPANRRFHAQTVACPKCGPKVYLLANNGELIENKDPIREAGRLLSEGNIVAVKGYGGFHVATSTLLDEPLERLRKTKHRKQKPFAIMARSLEVIRTFAEMSVEEAKILTSYMRPIVLLNKNEKYYLSDLVAPELHNVGVMLPYTGLHYMLFDKVSDPAYVMTSANPPNQPIVKDDDEAFEKLGEVVDYFLIHNRRIAHRCDDSVIRLHGEKTVFIRRSRGYSPEPVILKSGIKNCTLGLGGEENNTACVILGNKAFLSQHIGDVENIATLEFLESSSKRLIRLTNSKVEAIACDLHPKFITTMLARKLAEENDWQMFQVQHHHAHLAALMAEHAVDEMVGICCDGYGYGLNGEAWGGEILLYRKDSLGFERLGHLQEQPLIGADLATRYPLRVAAGILNRQMDVENWLMANVNNLPYGEREAEIILSQLKRGMNIVKTTSCGRILDAISAILGICYERTYEGEPSMKLESAALRGQNSLKIEPVINGNLLDTTRLVREIFERKEKSTKFDLALSAHIYLAEGLASLAIEKAIENNVKTIGFTGGVACNQIISSKIRITVESAGLKFLVHETVPPGDGGISLGQSFLAGLHQD